MLSSRSLIKIALTGVVCLALASCAEQTAVNFPGSYSSAPSSPTGSDFNVFTRMNDG